VTQRRNTKSGSTGKPARQPAGWLRWIPYLVLVGLAVLAYVNAGHPAFFFDSAGTLIQNPRTVDLGGTWRQFWQHPLAADEQLSHLTFAGSYALNRALGRPGFEVAGFLVFNVLLHGLNACLVYILVRSLLRLLHPDQAAPTMIPLVLAALFAVHPLHGSSVAYIAQRRGMLATTFYLLATLAYLSARRPGPVRAKRVVLGAAVLACWWLSYRAKSVGLTLPVALLVLEFGLRAGDRAALRRYLRYLVPGLVICAAVGIVFAWTRSPVSPQEQAGYLPPGPHFLTELRVFVHYWKLLLLPLPGWMSIDHDFAPSVSIVEPRVLAALTFHVVLLAMAVLAARRGYTLAAVGVLWFYVTLLPYALVPQSELLVEYKTYLPSIGLVAILAELLGRWARRGGTVSSLGVAGVAVALLLGLTLHRNRVYQSDLALWSDAAAKSPNRLRPRVNLANSLRMLGRLDEAIEQYHVALAIAPHSYTAHSGLGLVLVDQGRLEEARQQYEAALSAKPDYAGAHLNLALLLARQGHVEEANAHDEQVLRDDPENDEAHNNLAVNLARQGRLAEAVDHFVTALRLNPEYAEAHCNLALTLVKQGRLDEAIVHYRAAIRLEPRYAPAYYKLGEALAAQGKTEAAIAQYQRALALKPDFAPAHCALGDALRSRKEPAAALEHYRAALRADASYADAAYGLGQALEDLGRPAEAVAAYRQALRCNPEHAGAKARLEVLARPSVAPALPSAKLPG
jgi:tetratricopeptide (TPR) repeat protein